MKKFLLSFERKILVVILAAFLLNVSLAQAQGEDSCKASMVCLPGNMDPMTMHFFFTGTVPQGSFQFMGTWDFGDGFSSGDSCPTHTYSQPGNYIVCLSFSICIGGGLSCHDDTCMSITVGNIAGIENPDGNLHSFYTYPNPAGNEFRVRSDAGKDIELTMKDMAGRIVFKAFVKDDEPVNASGFSNGIYYLEASDGTRMITRKMVVRR